MQTNAVTELLVLLAHQLTNVLVFQQLVPAILMVSDNFLCKASK